MDALVTGWFARLAAAGLGLAVGSFANVVIYRSPREGLTCFRPSRSFCPSCRAPIAWHDNIPVLSWLVLRGRCRACGQKISARYPAIELLVAALFVAAAWLHPPVDADAAVRLGAAWYLIATCVIVSLVDLEHLIIPDSITWTGIGIGVAASIAFPVLHLDHPGFRADQPHTSSLMAGLFGLAAGGGSLMAVGMLGNLMLRRKLEAAGVPDAMGWGDVKWMALAGTFLGAWSVLRAILIGCFAGALVGIVLKLTARVRREESPVGVPFGPFLSLGILVELAAPGCVWLLLQRIVTPS